MSEFRFYDFLSIDRALTKGEQEELHDASTRAVISARRFTDAYNWGDLDCEVDDWIRRFFDIHLHYTNYGDRRLALRLPANTISAEALQVYLGERAGENLAAAKRRGRPPKAAKASALQIVTVSLGSDALQDELDFSEDLIEELAPLRDLLISGDLRALYIIWLARMWNADYSDVDEDDPEPPVPAGLKKLTEPVSPVKRAFDVPAYGGGLEPLKALAHFLGVSQDMLSAGAMFSPDEHQPVQTQNIGDWIRALPLAEKDSLLLQAAQGQGPEVSRLLQNRFQQTHRPTTAHTRHSGRSAQEVSDAINALMERREAEANQRKAKAEQKQKRAEAAAKKKRKAELAQEGPKIWARVEALIDSRQTSLYQEAASILALIKEIAHEQGTLHTFQQRLSELKAKYSSRRALLKLLASI